MNGCRKYQVARVGPRFCGQGEQVLSKEITKGFQDAQFPWLSKRLHSLFTYAPPSAYQYSLTGSQKLLLSDITRALPIALTVIAGRVWILSL